MSNREWIWKLDASGLRLKQECDPSIYEVGAQWAIVERLEALVSIMDDIGEVADVIANHLTFGGQPVGEATPPNIEPKFSPASWQCKATDGCVLFDGHQGNCVLSQPKVCRCVKPVFEGKFIGGKEVCAKCGYPEIKDAD